MKSVIKEWIYLILFVIAGVLVLIYKDNLLAVGLILGVSFAVFGLIYVFCGDKVGFAPLAGGIALTVSLLFFKFDVLNKYDCITFGIVSGFGLLLVISLIYDFINEKIVLNSHELKVTAKVIDLEKNPNTKEPYFRPIYEYSVDGKVMTVAGLCYFKNNIPKIGDSLLIHVNKDDNLDVYFSKNLYELLTGTILSLCLLIVCVVIIIKLFI